MSPSRSFRSLQVLEAGLRLCQVPDMKMHPPTGEERLWGGGSWLGGVCSKRAAALQVPSKCQQCLNPVLVTAPGTQGRNSRWSQDPAASGSPR